jgi:hypothetical protein
MISDELFQAISDLRDYQAAAPRVYQTVATEVQTVITVMGAFQMHLDLPPLPHPTLPEYEEKHRALCESLRGLDLSEVQTATNELMEHVAKVGPRGKRKPSKNPHLHRGAMALARVVEKIRGYQEPPWENFYETLTSEIEVVVTVVRTLRQYLDALAQPRSEGSEPSQPVKRLGESLRGLDVGNCEKCMKDLYDYLALAPRSVP